MITIDKVPIINKKMYFKKSLFKKLPSKVCKSRTPDAEVAFPISIGATKLSQLDESLAALSFEITPELLKEIEQIQAEIMYPMG